MVEQFIGGRELAVAMWGNEVLEILPIAEDDYSAIPNPLEHLLTYESKWKPESPLFQNIPARIPAVLNDKEEQSVHKVAEGSFRAVGLRDLGRVGHTLDNGILTSSTSTSCPTSPRMPGSGLGACHWANLCANGRAHTNLRTSTRRWKK